LAAAEPYLMSVRDDYEVSCVVTTLLGGDIVVIGRYDHTRVPPTSMRLDDVVPAIPPVGRAFVAWADPAAVNAWLDRLGDTASVQLRERYEQMLTGIRRRGYLLNRETGTYARLGELAARLRSVRVPDELEAIIDSLQDAVAVQGNELTTANLRSVSVPVFDATGRVLMTLTGVNFPPDITRDALGQQVHALLRAAAEVTTALGGRHPGPDPLRDSARPPRISDGDFDELFPHASVPV
jgi:DNA-binding IclR family transcriptional regulator